jgi:uncharacterized damage-inducible protein DinB
LRSLGARSVPVVSRGKEFVFGQMLKDVAAFIGVDYDTKPKLSPQELVDRLDFIMTAAQRFVAQIPDEKLDDNLRNRKRPIRDLCYHIFRLEEVFLEVVEDGLYLTRDLLNTPAPDHIRTSAELVAYGKAVQQRVRDWWAGFADKDCTREVDSYYGKQPLHNVLERHTWHPAQHVRQLMMLLRQYGIEPEDPVSDDEFAGLPIPEKVWDDEAA